MGGGDILNMQNLLRKRYPNHYSEYQRFDMLIGNMIDSYKERHPNNLPDEKTGEGYTQNYNIIIQRARTIYNYIFSGIVCPYITRRPNNLSDYATIGYTLLSGRFGGIINHTSQISSARKSYYVLVSNNGWTAIAIKRDKMYTYNISKYGPSLDARDSIAHCITWLCMFDRWGPETVHFLK